MLQATIRLCCGPDFRRYPGIGLKKTKGTSRRATSLCARPMPSSTLVSMTMHGFFTATKFLGVELMERRSEVAALACDILSADRPAALDRLQPVRTHTFIGCGHLLRLSAVREVGYYTPNPGFYGAEEKDLCVQLLDRHYEILFLPGVHVWHDKSTQARDLEAQHRSGVCNDFVFALRRCPLPMALWLIPGKVVSHLRFAVTNDLLRPCLKGMAMFCAALPSVALTRKPVSSTAFHEYLRRSRVSA